MPYLPAAEGADAALLDYGRLEIRLSEKLKISRNLIFIHNDTLDFPRECAAASIIKIKSLD